MHDFKIFLAGLFLAIAFSSFAHATDETSATTNSETKEESVTKSAWVDGFNFKSDKNDQMRAMFSPYTIHYNEDGDDGEGHDYVWLIGLERERANGNIMGIAYFSNSFGQPCIYYFPWGKVYRDLAGVQGLYAKWSAGLAYGYVDPYEDKVPINYNGFSPAVFPSIGFTNKKNYQAELTILGTAGLMFQFYLPIK
ncbi:MAG TPA: hypothetical protein VN247_03650 [Arenimonas sp.]|nr:hypothetical protein [Arenimonas sp.]